MRVKICGITSYEDAMVAVECGADALGFVFYEPSPRFISIQKAREIVRALPPFVEKVGLFVHKEADFIDEVCLHVGLGLAQLHWEVGDDFMSMLTTPSLLVVRAKSKDDLTQFNDKYRLVDAFVDGFGGAGKRVELEWFKEIDCSKIILAGGLEAHQMESLKPFGFYGVDVSSGVEKSKGVKDAQKIEQFIKAAKA
jgi:phosphoribosylanthranilate isomerase